MPTANPLRVALMLLTVQATLSAADQKPVAVADDASFRLALSAAKPGTRITVAPGRYRGGIFAEGLHGTAEAPIVIEAADPKNKPIFEGGAAGLHLRGPRHLVLRNLAVRGQSGNGLNIDDGGRRDSAHHVTLENVEVSDVGPRGNTDAIKLSGLDDVVVRNCRVEGWGGEGIDMVGCHRMLIEGCTFTGKQGFGQTIAVQAKGGSSNVTVRRCNFLNAAQRGVNIGGSTGREHFRPNDAKYEAKEITVEGCRFVGCMSPVAFVGVDGAVFRYNTLYHPDRWAVRILQENTEPGMVPSRNGRFERNLIVYSRAQVRAVSNVGGNTEPATFRFADNLWHCDDAPNRSRPDLPAAETNGVYDIDPKVTLKEGIPFAPGADKAKAYGADALPETRKP